MSKQKKNLILVIMSIVIIVVFGALSILNLSSAINQQATIEGQKLILEANKDDYAAFLYTSPVPGGGFYNEVYPGYSAYISALLNLENANTAQMGALINFSIFGMITFGTAGSLITGIIVQKRFNKGER